MIADKRVYRTSDGVLCDEDDPRAAFLVCGVGQEIPTEYLGVVEVADDSEIPGVVETMDGEPGEAVQVDGFDADPVKRSPKAGNKQLKPADNK